MIAEPARKTSGMDKTCCGGGFLYQFPFPDEQLGSFKPDLNNPGVGRHAEFRMKISSKLPLGDATALRQATNMKPSFYRAGLPIADGV
jgi:hypothetical protein